jgi:hypothetical protein
MTTSTIPTTAKRKEIVRHGPSTLCVMWAHRGTDLVKPPFLAIARATEKIVVDFVCLCVVVVGIGDADEYCLFSLSDPCIESEIGKF